MNLKTLFRTVHDDESAIQFLQEHQIIPKELLCPNGHSMRLSLSREVRWRCNKRACRVDKGIRQGNWLEGTKLPLESIVHFIYCWARGMSSVKFCQRELSMAHATISEWNNCMRELCVTQIEQRNKVIGGEGLYVEIDDCILSRKSNKGITLSKQTVFGGLCKETKECFLVQIPDRSADTLMPIIKNKIKPGSIIVSESWRIYRNIATDDLNFINPETLDSTQQERLWGSAKWSNKKREASFLAEFMWRTTLNNRDPFDEVLSDIATFK